MSVAETVRKVIAGVDKDQTVLNIVTAEQDYSDSLAPWRFLMRLFGVFAALAVSLASVGIYGVMSYAVGRRKHEIGVRLALGAGKRRVLTLVIAQGLKLTLIGIAVGVAGAFALTRLIANMLFEVKPGDPLTLRPWPSAGRISLLACYLPAPRAQMDPHDRLEYQ